MDVDGTLTDGKIYLSADGELMKAFDIKDGYAINELLPRYEIISVIIAGRQSAILEYCCEELGIDHLFPFRRYMFAVHRLTSLLFPCL
jgi:3-deoxy-D-manno-octulosonate 8-phosphate phosphatase (KDO 8-P phosphatase)